MLKSKLISAGGVIVNKETLIKKMWKQAFLKAGMKITIIKDFLLSKEWRPIRNLSNQEFNILGNRKLLSDKFQQQGMHSNFDLRDVNKSTSVANGNAKGLIKNIDYLGKAPGMSSAQIVYQVILKQQIEWMDETPQV